MSTQRTPRQRLGFILARIVALAVFAGVLVLNSYFGFGYTGVDRSGASPKITFNIIVWDGMVIVRDVADATRNSTDSRGSWTPVLPEGLYGLDRDYQGRPSDWTEYHAGNGSVSNRGVFKVWYVWSVAMVIVTLLCVRDVVALVRTRPERGARCRKCGYSLDGISGKCPECGSDWPTAS